MFKLRKEKKKTEKIKYVLLQTVAVIFNWLSNDWIGQGGTIAYLL